MNSKKILSLPHLKGTVFSPVLYLIIRTILGGIFIFSGSLKLMDTYRFARILYQYGILPDYLINTAAICIPVIEIAAGSGLLFNLKYSLELITGMLLLFICVLWFGILHNLNIDCGCFSSEQLSEHGNLNEALYRDFGFIALSAFLFISRRLNSSNRPQHLILRNK